MLERAGAVQAHPLWLQQAGVSVTPSVGDGGLMAQGKSMDRKPEQREV